jgi:hypothetical protein
MNNSKFPHEIKSVEYWSQILVDSPYALRILDTIINKQSGFASDNQMNILRKVERGDKRPYNSKN